MAEQPRPLYAELRKREICSILQTHGQVSVEELCARFLMSPATIRNDLSELARSGLLQRTHGGAIRCAHPAAPEFPEQGPHGSADPMLRIARRALSFIQPGDVIALDAGAATYALSSLLAGIPDLTIITNDLKIAAHPVLASSAHLILLGGLVRRGSHCTVGRSLREASQRFYIDKLFLTADGMSAARGFSTPSMECADAKRALLALADQVIVLADSTKAQHSAFISFAPLQAADVILTDTDISPVFLRAAKTCGVQVICT